MNKLYNTNYEHNRKILTMPIIRLFDWTLSESRNENDLRVHASLVTRPLDEWPLLPCFFNSLTYWILILRIQWITKE